MSLTKKYFSKFFHKQWGIGIVEEDLAEVIRQKKSKLSFTWCHPDHRYISYADPFIFQHPDGNTGILFEKFSADAYDGEVCLFSYNPKTGFSAVDSILKKESHLSYPFIFRSADAMYVIPENAFSGSVTNYAWNFAERRLMPGQKMLDFPLIDPTIIRYRDKFWLFGTRTGPGKSPDKVLHIFYSDSLAGPYTAHKSNPVKNTLEGSRPAGAFIVVDGEIFRPAQNSANYYGEYLSIYKIKSLTEDSFEEEEYMKIYPDAGSPFSKGIHTINAFGGLIVVDGLRFYFEPLRQIWRWLRRE